MEDKELIAVGESLVVSGSPCFRHHHHLWSFTVKLLIRTEVRDEVNLNPLNVFLTRGFPRSFYISKWATSFGKIDVLCHGNKSGRIMVMV